MLCSPAGLEFGAKQSSCLSLLPAEFIDIGQYTLPRKPLTNTRTGELRSPGDWVPVSGLGARKELVESCWDCVQMIFSVTAGPRSPAS